MSSKATAKPAVRMDQLVYRLAPLAQRCLRGEDRRLYADSSRSG